MANRHEGVRWTGKVDPATNLPHCIAFDITTATGFSIIPNIAKTISSPGRGNRPIGSCAVSGRRVLTCVLAVVFLVSSCAQIKERRAIKKCRFRIEKMDIASFSLSSLSIGLVIEILNPLERKAVLDRMDLSLFIENKLVATVRFEPVIVPQRSRRLVRAMVDIPFSSLGIRIVDSMKRGGRVRYRLSGHAYVKTALGISAIPVTAARN